ncbi:transporter substrate-binding domain-containing protein [Chitinibacter bivalviorum]|uniref:Transporter substrate-binding domain-containing protein n=1 Tax=Chitinibacter bivalviorum TaxID=2739434 RepID=A0A7H9BQP1_9NEIS|nr:transporter substrate-binding domain-containing protein [Chitinibacter bivalviorum]QLG89554.1 transporter substrate-binding domain-containing protein [Chitinibacter bivalviorum]
MRILMLLIACLSAALSEAAPVEITLFASDNYRPISWREEQGQAKGLAVEAVEFVQKDTGIQLKLELMPWNRAYKLAEQGQGGVIGLSYTPERAGIFDYSKAIYDSGTNLVQLKKSSFAVKSLAELSGKKIGALIGVSYGIEIDQAAKNGVFEMVRDTSHTARLKNLLAGRIDAALLANAVTDLPPLLVADPELKVHADEFVVLPKPLAADPIHVAFRKGSVDSSTRSKLYQSFEKWARQRSAH